MVQVAPSTTENEIFGFSLEQFPLKQEEGMLGKQSPTLQGLVVVEWMEPMMFSVFTVLTLYLGNYLGK